MDYYAGSLEKALGTGEKSPMDGFEAVVEGAPLHVRLRQGSEVTWPKAFRFGADLARVLGRGHTVGLAKEYGKGINQRSLGVERLGSKSLEKGEGERGATDPLEHDPAAHRFAPSHWSSGAR